MHKPKFVVFIFLVHLIACSNLLGDISSTPVKIVPNQNGTEKAVLLENTGNATTDFSLQVSVYDHGYKLAGNEIRNTFSVDSNHDTSQLDSNSIHLNWISSDTLLIDYNKKMRTFIKQNKVNEVTILYKTR